MWKSFNQIVKDLNERGSIQVPNGYVTGEEFEKWLKDESKGKLSTEKSEKGIDIIQSL